jgi:hypothetical protein
MKGFASWLHDLNADDPDLAALKAFADGNTPPWPFWSDDPADYLRAIRTPPIPANRDQLTDALAKYFVHWRGTQISAKMSTGKIALIVVGLLFAALMAGGLFLTDFYSSLARTEQVRGLITFLFVLVATSIILVFALGIFWVENSEDVTKRFAAAKDLLTIVVGIVGTIMGFYFGTANGEGANLSVSAFSPPVVHAAESVTMTGHINGGVKPYKYSIAFTDPSKALTAEQLSALGHSDESKDGAITWKVTGPAVKDGAEAIANFKVTVTDAKNVNTTSNGILYIEPAKKVPQPPQPPAAK